MSRLLVTVVAVIICAMEAAATECGADLAFCGSTGATVADCVIGSVAQSCPTLCGLCVSSTANPTASPTASPTFVAVTPPKVATVGGDLHLNSSSTGRVLFNGMDLEEMLSSEILELRGVFPCLPCPQPNFTKCFFTGVSSPVFFSSSCQGKS